MDAHLFRLFAKSASYYLNDCRIEKIQEPDPGLLTINLNGRSFKKQLNWSYKKNRAFCFMSNARLASRKEPSAHVMRLRKYFNDRKISSAVFQFCQRRLWLLPARREDEAEELAPWLCLDLSKGPSLHFLSAEQAPLEDSPKWPLPAELEKALENWQEWPVLTPLLRKRLKGMEEEEQWALLEDLRSAEGLIFHYVKNVAQGEETSRLSAWPLELHKDENCLEVPPEGHLSVFEKAGSDLIWRDIREMEQDRLIAPLLKKMVRQKKILEKMEQDEKRLKYMSSREKEGKALQENLWRFDSEKRLSEITVDIGGNAEKIELDSKFNLLENMEKFFHESKRGKRGLKILECRKKELLEEIAELEKDIIQKPENIGVEKKPQKSKSVPSFHPVAGIQRNLPKNVQAHVSTDGHIFLRGKDASGNRIVLKLAQPHDLWAHVETGQGAHVIIRLKYPGEELTEQTFAEAASLAAVKSWHREAGQCSVMFAEARHVHPAKHGGPGKVVIDKLARTDIFTIDTEIEEKLRKGAVKQA